MNEKLLADNNKIVKVFSTLTPMQLRSWCKTKELLGLVASAVLRCDDCVKYHLKPVIKKVLLKKKWWKHGNCNISGGTIVVPHLRRHMNSGKP
jgi:alkylhydroperoxidase family enzyme